MESRRYRSIVITSGLILFVCMFLPAMKGCHDHGSISPLQLPFIVQPYLYGLVLALAAIVNTRRAFRRSLLASRLLVITMLLLALVIVSEALIYLIVVIIAVVGFWWALGIRRRANNAEYQVARGGVCASVVFSFWFAEWCFDRDSLFGVWVSLASSIGLLVGSILWTYAANTPYDDPNDVLEIQPLPVAHARVRD